MHPLCIASDAERALLTCLCWCHLRFATWRAAWGGRWIRLLQTT